MVKLSEILEGENPTAPRLEKQDGDFNYLCGYCATEEFDSVMDPEKTCYTCGEYYTRITKT